MGILADWQIETQVKITPFEETRARPGIISYGVTSYGYDARLGYKFKVFTSSGCNGAIIDPKKIDPSSFIDIDLTPTPGVEKNNYIIIPPYGFILGETIEEFTIPRSCLAIVLGKSTYARCALIVNVTPLEPEWSGKVTIELSNTASLPIKVYCNEGIMQILFLRADAFSPNHHYIADSVGPHGTCMKSYADKKGKYQNQTGVTMPTVDPIT